jgi:ribosomal protein S18 acetylase RimI-like enzyme
MAQLLRSDCQSERVIERLETVSDAVVEAFQRLVPQLSRTSPAPGRSELEEIAATQTLLVDWDGEALTGALTLVLYRIPTGLRARIEDVVVDETARSRGVGEALTREAIRLAREAGATHVELTSHPSREAANRLYRRLGFEPRQTNVYRYEL